MPELPEVETVVRSLAKVLDNATVHNVRFYRADLREEMPKREVRKVLKGQQVSSVRRVGKYIVFVTALGYVVSHLGMTGRFSFSRGSKKIDVPHTHFDVVCVPGDDPKSRFLLSYVDARRFGRLGAGSGDYLQHKWLSSVGMEPLGRKSAVAAHLLANAKKRKKPIKNYLMDGSVVAGIGNIYACEALFRARIDPRRTAGSLSKAEMTRLTGCVQTTLRAAIRAGGTTIRDFESVKAESGYFALKLNVYDRAGDACKVCKDATIERIVQAGRSTFFCAHCQT